MANSNSLKTLVAVVALTSSSFTWADMFPDDADDQSIWQISVAGQYIQQQPDELPYTASYHSGTGNTVFQGFPMLRETPDKTWAGKINLGYVFASQLYDIRASYTDLSSDRNSSITGSVPGSPDVFTITQDATFDYMDGDINVGTYFTLADRFMIRIGIGLLYADINQHGTGSATDISTTPNIRGNDTVENKFQGFGPELTIDSDFALNEFFSFVTAFGVGVPVGESRVQASVQTAAVAGLPGVSLSFEDKDTQAALAVEGKVGLRYAQTINDHWSLNIEGGYEGITYQHALQEGPEVIPLAAIANSPGLTLEYNGNYYNYGPYIEVGVDFGSPFKPLLLPILHVPAHNCAGVHDKLLTFSKPLDVGACCNLYDRQIRNLDTANPVHTSLYL